MNCLDCDLRKMALYSEKLFFFDREKEKKRDRQREVILAAKYLNVFKYL